MDNSDAYEDLNESRLKLAAILSQMEGIINVYEYPRGVATSIRKISKELRYIGERVSEATNATTSNSKEQT